MEQEPSTPSASGKPQCGIKSSVEGLVWAVLSRGCRLQWAWCCDRSSGRNEPRVADAAFGTNVSYL